MTFAFLRFVRSKYAVSAHKRAMTSDFRPHTRDVDSPGVVLMNRGRKPRLAEMYLFSGLPRSLISGLWRRT